MGDILKCKYATIWKYGQHYAFILCDARFPCLQQIYVWVQFYSGVALCTSHLISTLVVTSQKSVFRFSWTQAFLAEANENYKAINGPKPVFHILQYVENAVAKKTILRHIAIELIIL